MVESLRAYFMHHLITIKWAMCVQKNIEHSSMPERPRLSSTKISGDISLAIKIKQQ